MVIVFQLWLLIYLSCLKRPHDSKVFGNGTQATGPPERPRITKKTAYRLMMTQVGGTVDDKQDQVSSTGIQHSVQGTDHILGRTTYSDIPSVDSTRRSS